MAKKNCFLLAGMLMVLVLPSLLVVALPRRLSEKTYHRIKDGMTRTQVEALLGPPEIRSKQYLTYHHHCRQIVCILEDGGFGVDYVDTIVIHTIPFDAADRVRRQGQGFGCVIKHTTFW
jgi:hypothetical protein